MLAFVVGGILVCTMFFLVISVSFDCEVLAVSGRYSCGHSLLPLANFSYRLLHCSCRFVRSAIVCLRLFHGCTIQWHCLLLRVIYSGNVFPYLSPVFMFTFAYFPSRISVCHRAGLFRVHRRFRVTPYVRRCLFLRYFIRFITAARLIISLLSCCEKRGGV